MKKKDQICLLHSRADDAETCSGWWGPTPQFNVENLPMRQHVGSSDSLIVHGIGSQTLPSRDSLNQTKYFRDPSGRLEAQFYSNEINN